MATLGSSPPSSPNRRKPKRWARRVERCCCNTITYFPLLFVYGLTSWAAWVEVGIGFLPDTKLWTGYASSFFGFALYLLLNTSYTTAVFTDPGSPGLTHGGYGQLPTEERGRPYTSYTVKSTGDIRYCKKCQCKKPDRAHHCSTCKRCVLKMDHHCPWLATCVGLRNYKPFLLFLIYTCIFCWLCFAVTATWLWNEVLADSQFEETLMPVNFILLAILSGIIGLVLTGFTAWHIWLACKGRTTIESLEKTRYLAPLRKSMRQQFDAQRNYVHGKGHARNGSGENRQSIGDQLREIHANALPGVTRPEEGEERSSPTPSRGFEDSQARQSLLNNYERYNQDYEEERERDRYQDYLDEKEDEGMPNAFDLGYKKNLIHVFGPSWWLWWLPVCNTVGDGWTWEANPQWLAARGDAERRREARLAQETEAWSRSQSNNVNHPAPRERAAGLAASGGAGLPAYQNQHMTLPQRMARDAQMWGVNGGKAESTPLQTLSRSGSPLHGRADDSSTQSRFQGSQQTESWNDLPDDMLKAPSRRTPDARSRSRGRRKESDRWENWDDGQNQ